MTFGTALRQARVAAGYTVADVSAHTRIREHVIADLESNNFQSVGGIAYARGHVRSIAKLIGADSDALVAELEATSGEVDRPMIDLLAENYATPLPRETSRISYKMLSTIAASVLGLLILVPAVTSLFSSDAKSNVPKSTTNSSATTSSSTSSSSNPVVATKTSDVNVVVSAINGSTWLGVTDGSGAQVFSGKLSSGQTQTFKNNQLLRLVIGNAGAVNLTVNGENLGTPGTTGEVVHLEFGSGSTNKG